MQINHSMWNEVVWDKRTNPNTSDENFRKENFAQFSTKRKKIQFYHNLNQRLI